MVDDATREYVARARTIGGELARELLAALDAAESRVAELENAARRMFNADNPRDEIAAERELKRLVKR